MASESQTSLSKDPLPYCGIGEIRPRPAASVCMAYHTAHSLCHHLSWGCFLAVGAPAHRSLSSSGEPHYLSLSTLPPLSLLSVCSGPWQKAGTRKEVEDSNTASPRGEGGLICSWLGREAAAPGLSGLAGPWDHGCFPPSCPCFSHLVASSP